jgi:S-sulfosulfanyl-L-cysteine sulfohydrolase
MNTKLNTASTSTDQAASGMGRREFVGVLAAASAAGLNFASRDAYAVDPAGSFYDFKPQGSVRLMHFTDCHAQLLPIYFREPNVNIGLGESSGKPPHLVGEALLKHFGMHPDQAHPGYARNLARHASHAFTYLNFAQAAKTYGKVGGFAHLATLVKRLRAQRPDALLLDGGDTWQGSATALWSNGQDMVDACKRLGVNVMTAHWEFTLGAKRVQEVVDKDFAGSVDFIAQNVKTTDFEDPVFKPYTLREVGGALIGIIGQAFPYTPIANPRYMVPDWTFGIQEERLAKMVAEVKSKGVAAVVLLSHNGMDVDLKLASRVPGIDIILGGHTHDGMPKPVAVKNSGGTTLVTNAGSNGKFLAVVDMEVKDKRVSAIHYRLLPIFANLLPPDADMQKHIDAVRAPHLGKLTEKLATTDGLLYRRGNFNGTSDQLILDALMSVKGAEIAFSPGFRWGTSLLPGQAITYEHVMDHTAISYPMTTVNTFTGAQVKEILEDVADNLFNPDPYYQQGGDMVRVGGMSYAIEPNGKAGQRITDMRLGGRPMEADKTYKVAGWAPVAEGAKGEPIWDVVSGYLKAQKTIAPRKLNVPRMVGMSSNAGFVAE